MSPRKLAITATQRLGKRVDHVEAQLKGQATRLDAVDQRVRELSQEVAEALHVGTYEAMYRLEREENIRLRQQQHGCMGVETTLLEGWIAQLEMLAMRMRPTRLPCPVPLCYAYGVPVAVDHLHKVPVQLPEDLTPGLTPEEQRIVEKFGVELSKGLGKQ